MIYKRDDIANYLIKESQKKDEASSSYWDEQHQNFQFHENSFSGTGPIGSYRPSSKVINLVHRVFQRKFVRMGEAFSKFQQIDLLANDIVKKQRRVYDLDVMRHTLSVSFVEQYCTDLPSPKERVACVIGDGYAMATSLLLGLNTSKVILINLTKTLLIDTLFLKKFLGEKGFNDSVSLVTDRESLDECVCDQSTKVVVIEAKNQDLLKYCDIDLAVNIASMQEMDLETIDQYFSNLKNISGKKLYFYCCNREEKVLPDGSVIRFLDYPWSGSTIVKDSFCPWYQDFYRKTPPFWQSYDGQIRHRIVKL